jgi:hypothetical protein
MLRTRAKAGDAILQGRGLGLLVAILLAGCGSEKSHPLAASDPSDAPTADTSATPAPPGATDSLGPTDSLNTPDSLIADSLGNDPLPPPGPPLAYTGLPFGPAHLWTLSRLNWGPSPFTASQVYTEADSLILQINAARDQGQRLVVAMAGGESTDYTTEGEFDLTTWKNTMDTYNTPVIQAAVAAAVADGTLIGNVLIDEPETKQWGTHMTKALVDQMGAYVKAIFPTLPVGVNHGPPGYQWQATERYNVVDFVRYQYNWYITEGDVGAWRDAVLAQAKRDGVTPALSINVLNGGVKDKEGDWLCVDEGQAGVGTYWPNCRMTPDQVKSWGTALAPYGCFFFMWQYDDNYISNPANQEAFQAIADLAASLPARSCRRA